PRSTLFPYTTLFRSDDFRCQLVGLARGGAVADGDEVHPVLLAQLRDARDRLVPLVARFVRVDRVEGQQFAGGIDDGQLAAGADAWIQAHHRLRTGGRGEQEVFQVVAEHADGFVLGAFAHA